MLSLFCSLLLSASLCAAPPQAMDRGQLAQQLQHQYGGKILDMQQVKTAQGPAYRVKLLQPSGRVKLLLIDSQNGKARAFGKQKPNKNKGKN